MKHRRNKVKREHGIIEDALTWLEELSRCSQVTDIIPGVIQDSHSPQRGIVYKYTTQTGCKVLLKSNGSIQEAFIVTKDPEFVREWLERQFPLHVARDISRKGICADRSNTIKSDKAGSKIIRPIRSQEIEKWLAAQSRRAERQSTNLGQLLDEETCQALRALQKNFKPSATRRRDDYEYWFLGGE